MRRIETVSLIGLGAIGSVYLSIISDALTMKNIRVIAGGDRGARYREKGVAVNGREFWFPIFEPDAPTTPADLFIFAVKQNQLEQAIRDAKNHIGSDTVIMSLLNGITSERIIKSAYKDARVLYSTVKNTPVTRVSNESFCKQVGQIAFGEALNRPEALSEDVKTVAEFFDRTGVPYEIPPDMTKAMWRKFMANIGINQLSAILGCRYRILQEVKSVRELAVLAMREVMELSQALGVDLSDEEIDETLRILDAADPDGKTSTLQDIEAGRRTEVDILGGVVMELAAEHGVKTPVNGMFIRLIRAKEDTTEYLLRVERDASEIDPSEKNGFVQPQHKAWSRYRKNQSLA
jgi:2-dehydropantoate 2-reductase